MAVDERDPHTGHSTTGHEWNGIKELNTPVPKPVWFFLIVTGLFAIGYWIAMPAWPTGRSFTPGMLGADDRRETIEQVRQGAAERAAWVDAIQAASYAQILADPKLMVHVRDDGKRLFGDNCAACHGPDGRGGKGFPDLTDRDWLWGGSPETIAQTIRVGVNSTAADTRVSQMLAFGRDGLLDGDSVVAVTDYVASFNDPAMARTKPRSVAAGRKVFEANCVACHGPDGHGNQTLGVPNLTDRASIYGHDWASIYATVSTGQQGQMPSWGGRLSEAELKLLTTYLLDLGRQAR